MKTRQNMGRATFLQPPVEGECVLNLIKFMVKCFKKATEACLIEAGSLSIIAPYSPFVAELQGRAVSADRGECQI